jgi:hypothetical protein
MLTPPYASILEAEGFRPIGRLHHRVQLTAWWNPAPDRLLQVVVLTVGRSALIKADKSYYLQSVTEAGETWARDVGLLHDWLEGHFPEFRMAFSHFRDVPAELARAEVARRTSIGAPTRPLPTVEQVAALQRQLEAAQAAVRSGESLMALSGSGADLLSGYLHQRNRSGRAECDLLRENVERERQRLGLLQHLQREYQRKGSAAVYTFGVSSNLQVVRDTSQFRDAIRAVVKELVDLHRYQVTQKLGGGRLNVQVAEATEPALAWVEQWLGGALTPAHVHRLGPEFASLRRCADDHVMVTPDEPIVVDGGAVRHGETRLAARVVSDAMRRLDRCEAGGGAHRKALLSPQDAPADSLPLALGHRVDASDRPEGPVVFPLAQMVHLYISGTTGGGKSYLARVLIEEAARYESVSVLVLDPRNQSVGLLAAEDRPKILQRFSEFGMDPGRAHGFPFMYYAPALSFAEPLPPDLRTLARQRSVVSFKGMDDQDRCAAAARVLDAAFAACGAQESESPRLLIVVDEAQLFTRRRCDEAARQAAANVERALDRVAREGRKFGIVLALVSQTMKDFSYELASVRQMTTTKIFLRNSDREIEYAADIVGDGRLLVQLPTGTALVHNANWGTVRLRVRPPYSKVFEPAEGDVRRLVGQGGTTPAAALSRDAAGLLDVIRRHRADAAAAASGREPLNMSNAAELSGIGSKRRLLELVDELERANLIVTRKLRERGRPRIIELVAPA